MRKSNKTFGAEGDINSNKRRVAIANRGEVACRIIRACRELGWTSVLLHSEADINSRAFREADERSLIGPSPTSESYLHAERVIAAAQRCNCDLLHPGFGFLSENADFAEAVVAAGLLFVGPSPASIRALGDKVSAKALAESLGLPTIPGYRGEDQSIARLVAEAERIGFPVVAKAAAGGGGRGMKVLRNRQEAPELIQSAQREGLSAFGSPVIFLERYFERAKHIEFQVFGDSQGRVVSLLDRECSVQRRHQKIIEEALSPSLTPELRQQMGSAAVRLAEAAQYQSAGTVEFLLQDGKFYFLEMNTRLQVEHPVTEEVLGIDLVVAQLKTAIGAFSNWTADELKPTGHAIECRIYAEDPYQGGIPSTGLIWAASWADGPGVRAEIGFDPGDEITSHYDSMVAKLIVTGRDRSEAVRNTIRALRQTRVAGVQLNLPFLEAILDHPSFRSGQMTTQFIAQFFPDGLAGETLSQPSAEQIRLWAHQDLLARRACGRMASFQRSDVRRGLDFVAHPNGVHSARMGDRLWICSGEGSMSFDLSSSPNQSNGQGTDESRVAAPMPGKIVKVLAREGMTVTQNQTLLVMEAMKMEYTIKAPARVRVSRVLVKEGQMVSLGEQLAELTADGGG